MKLNLVNGTPYTDDATDYYVSVRDLVMAYKTGHVRQYENNRGGHFDKKRARSIGETYDPNKVNMIVLERTNQEGVQEIKQGHHRIYGMDYAYDRGLLTDDVLDSKVLVRLAEIGKGMAIYAAEGRGKGHTTVQKISNPDMGLGKTLNAILERIELPDGYPFDRDEIIRGQYRIPIIYCTISVQKRPQSEWRSVTYIDVSANRKTGIAALVDLMPEEMVGDNSISPRTKTIVADALQYVVDVYLEFISLHKNGVRLTLRSLPDYASRLLEQGTFFGLLLWAKISGDPCVRGSAKNLAKKLRQHNAKLLTRIGELHVGGTKTDNAVDSIAAILNPSAKKKRRAA